MGKKKACKRPKNDALRYDANLLSRDRNTLNAFLDEAARDFIREDNNQLPPMNREKVQASSAYGEFRPTKRQKPKSALLEAASQALGYSEPEYNASEESEDSTVSALMQAAADVAGVDVMPEETAVMDVPEPVRQGLTPDQVGAPAPIQKPFKHRSSVSFGGTPRKLRIKDHLGDCIVIPSLVSGSDSLKIDNPKEAIMQWLRPFAILTMAPHAIFDTEDFIKRMSKEGVKCPSGFTFLVSQELAPEYILCYNMNDENSISDWSAIADKIVEDYDAASVAGIMISAMIHLYKNRWAAGMTSDVMSSWLDDDNDKAQDHFVFDLTHDEHTMLASQEAKEPDFGILEYDYAIECMVNGLADYVDLQDYDLPEGMEGASDDDDEDYNEEEYEEETSIPTPVDPGYYSEESAGVSNDEEPFRDFDASETRQVFGDHKRVGDEWKTQSGSGAEAHRRVSADSSDNEEVKEAEETESRRSVPAVNGSGDDSNTKPEEEKEEKKENEVGSQRPSLPKQGNPKEEEKEEESMVVGLICN